MKLEELRCRHEIELKEFDLHWEKDDTLRKYRKPSSKLLGMLRQEKVLARLKRFDAAEVLQVESGELTRRELRLAQAMANRDYHTELTKLERKQRGEVDMLRKTRRHRRDTIVSRHQVENGWMENRKGAVKIRVKGPPRVSETQLSAINRQPLKTRFQRLPVSFEFHTVLPSVVSPSEVTQLSHVPSVAVASRHQEDTL
jgi:hypothetical protein